MPATRPVPARLRTRPFTCAEASAYGVTAQMLRGKRFRRMLHGVYTAVDVDLTPRMWAYAALLVLPQGSAIARTTALWLWGVEVGQPLPIHATGPHPNPVRHAGLRWHRRRRPVSLCRRDGLAVTTPELSFIESCLELGFVDRVIAGDWLLRLGHITLTELSTAVATSAAHGVKRARRALAYVRERVDSPRETVLRLMLVLARLPEPQPNLRIGDRVDFIARPDLVYVAYRVVVEYDGQHHWATEGQRERDIARREALEAAGWRVVVITRTGMRQPRDVAWRVYRALREGGYDGPQPRFDAVWMRWFCRP
jgi:very-short-patch-repair endonuclease